MDFVLLAQIFFINLLYITLNTIRTILTMRGYRKIAPAIAIFEIIAYTIGLSTVMQYLDQPIYLIVYALGFGTGIYVGIMIEDKLALGYSIVEVISSIPDHTLADELRNKGYGVTLQSGYGRDGERLVLSILLPRSSEIYLYKDLSELDPDAFYYSSEAKYIKGGFWSKQVNKDRINDEDVEMSPITEEDYTSKEDFIDDDYQTIEDYEKEQQIGTDY